MNNALKGTLRRLYEADWFSAVGGAVEDPDRVLVVSSWAEAVSRATSPAWEDVKLGMAGNLSTAVEEKSPARSEGWNYTVRDLKPLVDRLFNDKVEGPLAFIPGGESLRLVIYWDVLHILLTAEYSDVVKPGFYAGLGYWYAVGRIQCGLQGSPPNHKVVVY